MGIIEKIKEAKVFIDDKYSGEVIRVYNSDSLAKIRNMLNIDKNHLFLNLHNQIIKCDDNYTAKDILKNEQNIVAPVSIISSENRNEEEEHIGDGENQYRIDLVSRNYNGESVNLYKNGLKVCAIKIRNNMNLESIKKKSGEIFNKDSMLFLTTQKTLIERTAGFKLKDVLVVEGGELKIELVEKNYYDKMRLIDILNGLEKTEGKIDWVSQEAFFRLIKDFASEEIANVIIEDIYNKIHVNQEIDDKQFIREFKNILNTDYKNSSEKNKQPDTNSRLKKQSVDQKSRSKI